MDRALPRILNCLVLMTVEGDPENPADPLPIYVGDFMEAKVQGAIKCMKNQKAPGIDSITAELMKDGGKCIVSCMTRICNHVWNSTDTPDD